MATTESLKIQQEAFKTRLKDIALEDDPLSVYVDFVQWTIDNFEKNDPASGLSQLLEEATKTYQDDATYKSDLRYLKLWVLHARGVSRGAALGIYSRLLKSGIGARYSLLYEEYAQQLELEGRTSDADIIYRKGIKRQARPTERLKNRYVDFQARNLQARTPNTSASTSSPVSRDNETKPSNKSTKTTSLPSTAASRYALMLAPPAPEKKPEHYEFNFSLLYTEEHGEFCIEEARTRSMGLLRKKWPALPIEPLVPSVFVSSSPSSSSSSTVSFKDDGQRFARAKRKSIMAGEPTVTINTKEALADVFGMYNSPDKTMKSAIGGKHAPVRQVEPNVRVPQFNPSPPDNENAKNSAPAFRPFVDENAGVKRKDKKPSQSPFTPYVDTESVVRPRPALSAKNPSAILSSATFQSENMAIPKLGALSERTGGENNFSKVFVPEPRKPLEPFKDSHTDDYGQPRSKPVFTHERARSYHDPPAPSDEPVHKPAFTPFIDGAKRTPFKVFSRPSECASDFTPKVPSEKPFVPFVDPGNVFIPHRDQSSDAQTHEASLDEGPDDPEPEHYGDHDYAQAADESQASEDVNDYSDDFLDEGIQEDFEAPLPSDPSDSTEGEYDEVESYQEAPLGGRFGQFNVMTPITERTFEFTSTTRSAYSTPSGVLKHIPENESEEDVQDVEEAQLMSDEEVADEKEDEGDDPRSLQPFRLPTGAASIADDSAVTVLERSTSRLTLADTLALSSSFRPSNPCNPFDPPILRSVLSRLQSDQHCYDLANQDSDKLDDLQKFAKRSRKTSGGSDAGRVDLSVYSLTLAGQRFNVTEKLGEGGFGAVFRAKDLGVLPDGDDSDLDDDDDEGEASIMALKVVKPRNLWEYHVLRRLHSALPPIHRRSIVFPHALYAFRDESYLVLEFCPQGTLLDIVNTADAAGVTQQGACLDELLVMFFTVELMRLLEAMHSIGFIHGDLKIDNCLLRLEEVPAGPSAWSSTYQPSGEGGWSSKGLKLIDFGRTIDTRLFPSGQQFIADWATDDRDCFEIREGRPWTYETDYFGLASIIYCMFFGKYIQASSFGTSVCASGDAHRKLATPLKRYWQTDLWNKLFELLLNPTLVRPDGQMPISQELAVIRKEMEAWLQSNCNRSSGTLKGLLKKVEMSCLR